MAVVRDIFKKHRRIVFNGNGYSSAWRDEAKRRGLPNHRTTPDVLDAVSAAITALKSGTIDLEGALAHHGAVDAFAEARQCCASLVPAMASVRGAADTLESIVADDLWPLPTYQEMLFII